MSHEKAEYWQETDIAHNLHPFTDPKYFDAGKPLVISHADGCYVQDVEGRRYLDGMAGLWCVNVGYGRQEIVDAACAQMKQLAFYNLFFQSATPPQIELSRTLAELTPEGLDHFFFANSGSEANDTIIRIVRHFWEIEGEPQKHIIISRDKAYHGSTVAATSLGGMTYMHELGKSLLPGFEHIMRPHHYALGGDLSREEFGLKAARALEEKILELGPENVAAFIGEPVQGAGGCIEPPENYWPEIERICRQYNILLIADEVICGFGRLGHWFGCDRYGFTPDLMTMAKGLSSGYLPISAVAISSRVHARVKEGGVFSHGYTYSGHPVSAAAALANIKLMKDENLIETVRRETAPYFRKRLHDAFDDHPMVGDVRGDGLMAALHLVEDKQTRKEYAKDQKVAIRCRDACLSRGLIMRAVEEALVLSPPLVISHDEIDELIRIATDAIDSVAEEENVRS